MAPFLYFSFYSSVSPHLTLYCLHIFYVRRYSLSLSCFGRYACSLSQSHVDYKSLFAVFLFYSLLCAHIRRIADVCEYMCINRGDQIFVVQSEYIDEAHILVMASVILPLPFALFAFSLSLYLSHPSLPRPFFLLCVHSRVYVCTVSFHSICCYE